MEEGIERLLNDKWKGAERRLSGEQARERVIEIPRRACVYIE